MSVETDIIEGDEATNGNDPIIVKKQDYEKKFREMRDISLNCSYNK